jgi:predicted dehydrogenase
MLLLQSQVENFIYGEFAMVRIAVIGCGNVSRGHIGAWLNESERAQIVALVDIAPQFAQAYKDQFDLRDAEIYTNYRDVLARDDVDMIDICTPSHLHAEQIMAAMEAGKHVMTEKPTGYNLEECRQLRWYAQKYPDLKVGVAYSLRYYPLNIRVRELINSGAIGRVMFAEASHNHPHDCSDIFGEFHPHTESDRSGSYISGSELTGATHVFDLMRYLFGEVKDVFSFRERYGTFVLMRFQNGALGKATAAVASNRGLATPHVLCIQGTQGSIFTQNTYNPPTPFGKGDYKSDAWSVGGYHGYIVTEGHQELISVSERDTGHGDATRTRNFLSAILEGKPLIASLEDAIRTSELLHAIWDSHNLEIRVPVHQLSKTG